jgi:beta-glucanase (GH16 family)
MNLYRGGPYQQALSGVTWLNNQWYDGNGYQTYGFEYVPGDTGELSWFVGDQYTWHLDYRAIRPNGNIGQRAIPKEPMAVVMNFGMSYSFTDVFLANLAQLMPATMRFDYVRIYQDPNAGSVTCDPPGYSTTSYIAKHMKAYTNPNLV